MGSAGVRSDSGKRRVRLLLASSSLAALLVGGGAPSAFAVSPCYTGPFPYTNNGAVSCIIVSGTSFSGNLVNSGTGTISPGNPAPPTGVGIYVDNSTITGQISNAGTISVNASGILVTNNATVSGGISNSGTISAGPNANGIVIYSVSAFSGGVTNSGTISAGSCGESINGVSTFSGGILNSGTISGGDVGIYVNSSVGTGTFIGSISNSGTITEKFTGITIEGLDTFAGGILNSGTIVSTNSPNSYGIHVSHVTQFGSSSAGGISNSGLISSAESGINIREVSIFAGSVSNSGTISAGRYGIYVSNVAQFGSSSAGGGIVNAGMISAAGAYGIYVDKVSTFLGGVTNAGTITAGGYGIALGIPNTFLSTFSGNVSNSGLIAANSGIVLGQGVTTFLGSISNSGTINAVSHGIQVGGVTTSGAFTLVTFSGGIANSGTISAAAGNGIVVNGVSTFAGGLTNSGRISANQTGIFVDNVATFSGNVSNSGTITAGEIGIVIAFERPLVSTFSGNVSNSGLIVAQTGIYVGVGVSTFLGAISNSGTILDRIGGDGIEVNGPSFFANGITNSGLIRGSFAGIFVDNVSTFAGGVSNSGTISAALIGIAIGEEPTSLSTFLGGISNSGMIIARTGIFVGPGVQNLFGGISNSGTILDSPAGYGIEVNGATFFANGISNSGLISANVAAIYVDNVSTFSGGVANSGTITAAGFGIEIGEPSVFLSTFSGNVSNSGIITARTGILIGQGVSTFLGVVVNSGTITGTGGTAIDVSAAPNGMTIDITGGAISGNIVGKSTTSGDTVNFALGSGSFAYSDTISGMQAVNINSGTLFDGGAITAAGVTVNSGGVLAPGLPNTFGTLSITGALTFNAGSGYEVMINNAGANSSTAVIGTGTTTINGGTVLVKPELGHYNATTYTILTSSSGVTVNTPFAGPQFVTPFAYTGSATVTYPTDQVDLNLGAGYAILTAPSGANQNQQNVILGIDAGIFAGDTVPPQFQNLGNLTGQSLLNALTQLDGEDGTGAATSSFTLMNEFLALILGDNTGGAGNGGGLGFAPDLQSELPPDIALAYNAILKAPPQPAGQRWSAWASGFGGGGFFQGNTTVGSTNLTATTYGSAAGMEYRPDPNTRLGFALAGSGLNWGLAQGLGTGRADAFQAGLYGKTYVGSAYLSGALAFGNNWFTTNRTAFAGDQLTATFTGQSYAMRAEGGYRYGVTTGGALIGVTPYAALQTQWFHTPAYSETDLSGGGFGLSYNANTANDTRSELGARFDDLTAWNNKPLMLRASLAWAHDWVSGTGLNAAFQALPGSNFTVNGAAVPHDSALTSASAQYFFTPNWSFTAKFDGEFAPTSQTYAGSGTLRFTW